ncbi:MAG TPA: transglycosylase SLT domain-containing protein [Verrucomicrobiae bacterium]|nr:transglycosylase SLT domain-containing protein [Verrucomicrobiae bacterium]
MLEKADPAARYRVALRRRLTGMAEQTIADAPVKAWLLSRSGPLAGTRVPMADGVTRIGRAPDNDLVVNGPDAATVSLYHVEISRQGELFTVRDLGSTNGTWVNGERIDSIGLPAPAIVQLGNMGPEFALVLEECAPGELDRTVEIDAASAPVTVASASAIATHENLLASAVARARRMRAHGVGGQTLTIMRDVIEQALRHSRRKLRLVGYSLLGALLAVTGLGIWKISALNREKRAIDSRIAQLEGQLQNTKADADQARLLSQLDDYQGQAQSLEKSLLYRLGGENQEDYVTRELHAVMAEFGAEVYSIPPDFIERVNHYIQIDQGADRPNVAHALVQAGGEIRTIRRILEEQHLPADLAYIPIVESALDSTPQSASGAAGPWQFTAPTARALGLRVDGQVDQRKDLVASTRASCKYLRDLILDFGTGSSVMLALAAYNSGAAKVKQAVNKTVQDPIRQRNFWYLYRTRALPLETREYVPKVFAAILIGRNPRHFGF